MNFFLFQIFPYISIAVFTIGSILRFDRDPYSWRSQSSQLLERRQLRIGSILFHGGILVILAGHIVGLLTPIAIFNALGIGHGTKQILAMMVGGIAGLFCFIGLCMLLYRRLFNQCVRVNSSLLNIIILILLLLQLCLGLWTITVSMQHLDGHEMINFMKWAQHIVTFRGDAHEYILNVALVFKLHITLGLFIIFLWPFTRLVHAFSVPIGFVFRPYQIVRKKEF